MDKAGFIARLPSKLPFRFGEACESFDLLHTSRSILAEGSIPLRAVARVVAPLYE
jgi:hypothetical protein